MSGAVLARPAAMTPDADAVLQHLRQTNEATALAIGKALQMTHERVYAALVSLDDKGLVYLYTHDHERRAWAAMES